MPPISKHTPNAMPRPSISAAQAQAIFGEAVAFHQRGQLAQAKARYEFILNTQPGHYLSLHLLGVLAAQTKNFHVAVELIGKAIDIFPNDPNFHINLGNALKELRQLDTAASNYEKAIALKPDYAEAHSNLGVVLQMLGQMEAAVAAYDKAIALKPNYAEAYSNRGNALKELGQLDAAIASCDEAIAISPGYSEAHFNRGLALQAMRRPLDAVDSYEKALAARPNYADACFHYGIALQELGRLDAAVASYDRAIALRPDHGQACYNRGVALVELQRHEAAIASYDQAIACQYDFAQAHSNRGVALQALGQWNAAVASFDKAIALAPDYADAYINRGVSLHALKQLGSAILSYDQALAIQPDNAKAHTNRGVAMHAQKQLDAALACYDKAIAVKPDQAEPYFYKSLVLLLRGELENGWDLYQWLWKTDKSAPKLRHFAQPAWSGEQPLNGKTILVHSEQGLGDMIQFCRYSQLLADRGARVVLEVPVPLMGLLRGLGGVSELVPKGSALPEFDYHCLLLALPRAFNTSLANIPGAASYLRSDPEKVAQWTARLGSKTKRRIGLVWSGSVEHAIDYNRSIALSAVVQALPDGFEYISLQKEVRSTDMPALTNFQNIRHFGDELVDFGDTAALCELMDIVISVDTSVAHLSGALGRPTWVLLPYVPDWRWLLERDDSPWYPSVRLYRQSGDGDWDGVFQKVRAVLLASLTDAPRG